MEGSWGGEKEREEIEGSWRGRRDGGAQMEGPTKGPMEGSWRAAGRGHRGQMKVYDGKRCRGAWQGEETEEDMEVR